MRAGLAALAVTAALVAPGARAFDPNEDRPLRVTVEVGSGLGVGTLGAFAGGLVGVGICAAGGGDHGEWGCFGPALLGAAVGAWWGMAGGIELGGYAMGGNGGFGWELLGQAGGTAAAGLLFWALDPVLDNEVVWWTTWIALPLTGGILGYELSSTRDAPASRGAAFVVPIGFRF